MGVYVKHKIWHSDFIFHKCFIEIGIPNFEDEIYADELSFINSLFMHENWKLLWFHCRWGTQNNGSLKTVLYPSCERKYAEIRVWQKKASAHFTHKYLRQQRSWFRFWENSVLRLTLPSQTQFSAKSVLDSSFEKFENLRNRNKVFWNRTVSQKPVIDGRYSGIPRGLINGQKRYV